MSKIHWPGERFYETQGAVSDLWTSSLAMPHELVQFQDSAKAAESISNNVISACRRWSLPSTIESRMLREQDSLLWEYGDETALDRRVKGKLKRTLLAIHGGAAVRELIDRYGASVPQWPVAAWDSISILSAYDDGPGNCRPLLMEQGVPIENRSVKWVEPRINPLDPSMSLGSAWRLAGSEERAKETTDANGWHSSLDELIDSEYHETDACPMPDDKSGLLDAINARSFAEEFESNVLAYMSTLRERSRQIAGDATGSTHDRCSAQTSEGFWLIAGSLGTLHRLRTHDLIQLRAWLTGNGIKLNSLYRSLLKDRGLIAGYKNGRRRRAAAWCWALAACGYRGAEFEFEWHQAFQSLLRRRIGSELVVRRMDLKLIRPRISDRGSLSNSETHRLLEAWNVPLSHVREFVSSNRLKPNDFVCDAEPTFAALRLEEEISEPRKVTLPSAADAAAKAIAEDKRNVVEALKNVDMKSLGASMGAPGAIISIDTVAWVAERPEMSRRPRNDGKPRSISRNSREQGTPAQLSLLQFAMQNPSIFWKMFQTMALKIADSKERVEIARMKASKKNDRGNEAAIIADEQLIGRMIEDYQEFYAKIAGQIPSNVLNDVNPDGLSYGVSLDRGEE